MKHRNPKNSRFRGFLHPSWVARLSELGGRGDGDKLGVDLAVVLLQQEVAGVYPAKLPSETWNRLEQKWFSAVLEIWLTECPVRKGS